MPRALIFLVPLFLVLLAAIACDGDEDGSPPGNRITPPSSLDEFLDQYVDEEIIEERCTYDPGDATVDCGDIPYQTDPPPADDDAQCAVLLVNDEPIAVRCSSEEPLTIIYYAIAR